MKKCKEKLLRKPLAVLLSLALLVGMVSVPVQVNAATISGDGWEISDDGSTLTITSNAGVENWAQFGERENYLENLNTAVIQSGVTVIANGAFKECANLIGVTIPDSVTQIGENAFENCKALKNIIMPDSVTQIGERAFVNSGIQQINIPSKITRIEDVTFSGTDLSEVIIPEGVTYIGAAAFNNCSYLETVVMPDSVTEIGLRAFGNSRISEVTIPGKVTKIGEGAFDSPLETVTMLGSIPPECGERAFFSSEEGFEIHVPAGTAQTYKTAWSAYAAYITAPPVGGTDWQLAEDGTLTIESDEGMGGWYDHMLKTSNKQEERDKVKKVIIKDGVTYIWSNAFNWCTNLSEVTISGSVEKIDVAAFESCRALKSIILPDSVTEIENNAFRSSGITEINIPKKITKIGSEAFCGTGISEVVIPEGVTYIGEMAFMNCQLLEKVTIQEGVQEIREGAFINCRMKEVTIPESVTKIGNNAFLCFSLEKVTMLGSIPPESDGSIFGDSDYGCVFLSNNTEAIHVPVGAANTYKAAWSEYADYIAGDPISAEDKAAIDAVVEKVGKIPNAAEVTDIEEYKKVIEEARSTYDSLTEAQKALVSAEVVKKLTDAEAEYDRLKEEEENREKANEVITKINGIGTVTNTADSKKKIEEARSAYDSLTEAQKALVSAEDVKKLTDAEAEYDRLKEEEDKEKANEVIAKINGIGTVTNTADSKKKIEEARSAYDSLTEAQKVLVPAEDVKKLTDAEAKYAEFIVQSVVEKIAAIGKETAGSDAWKQKVEEAEAAYNSLSGELKEKVSAEDVKKLTDAEAEYNRLKEEEDKEKANEVIVKINGIGEVANTADSKKKIDEARSAYDSLTEAQKALVPAEAVKKLTDAEAAYQKLVQGEDVVTPPVSDPLAGLTEEQREQVRKIMEKLNVSVETAIKVQKLGGEMEVDLDVLTLADEVILNEEKEGDIKGSSFSKIQARAVKATKNAISLKWNKVKGADGYQVYGTKCGKNKYKELKTITKNSTVKYTQKKLKKGSPYRYVVKAYKVVDGKKITIAISKTIHESTEGGKKENLKSIKVNKTNVKIKKGKKFTIKAKEIKKKGSVKKLLKHRKVCYESSNTSIATVSKKGVIKGLQKGNCIVWVYGQNGMYKKIKVKVS